METITKSADITTKEMTLDYLVKKYRELKGSASGRIKLDSIDPLSFQRLMEVLIGGYSKPVMTGKDGYEKSREVLYAKDCIDSEMSELTSLLPWKSWKEKQYSQLGGQQYEEFIQKDGGKILFELIDQLFFASVLQIKVLELLKLDPQEFDGNFIKFLYATKYAENLKRVESGSFDKAGDVLSQSDEFRLDWIRKNFGKDPLQEVYTEEKRDELQKLHDMHPYQEH